MNRKKNMQKLFGALIIGGASIAQAMPFPLDPIDPAVDQPSKPPCMLELTAKKVTVSGIPLGDKTTLCLDKKSNEEIIAIIEEMKKPTCETPHCNCWLG